MNGCNPSAGVASYGAGLSLPQISFASASTDLSNQDQYPYFSRTIPADDKQGEALVNVLEYLGVRPYVSVVWDASDYSVDFKESFVSRYGSLCVTQ